MNSLSSYSEQLHRALTAPTHGVLGMVDDLLAVSRECGIQLHWQAGRCRVCFREGDPASCIEVPMRKSVFRAALARIAVLCNQRQPNSVSPYGGKGELLAGVDPTVPMQVEFINTPDEQRLELASLRHEAKPAEMESSHSGLQQETVPAPGVFDGTANLKPSSCDFE